MKFIPFKRKISVTCTHERQSDKKVVPFITITDEGDKILLLVHNDDDATKNDYWMRVSKEKFLGMVGSLWPNEVAILTDEEDNA